MTDPLLPAYGAGALGDVLTGIGSHLGLPGCREDLLGLPAGERWVVLLVDGLGWQQTRAAMASTPFFAGAIGHGRPITAGVPSTTATSLTSLGTGLTPGQHGIAGYTFRNPHTKRIFSPLTWDPTTDPLVVQPMPTMFERARTEGVAVTSVLPARFDGSGLTAVALRGGAFVGVVDEHDDAARVEQVLTAAARGPRSLVYVYERLLDHAGHGRGTASNQWLAELIRIDAFAEALRDQLPDDVRLVVTGDHGMVDVPADHRITIEDEPELLAGVDLIGGEARLRQLYTATPDAVAARWADRLGSLAWVRTREEAHAEGWLGKLAPRVADHFGDVLVAMRDDWAVLTREVPGEFNLVGMHGSLTPAEMEIPLVCE
ncbi:MAG TPA: alkaline phosphatase family protein [Propionibacteriaceae bacterium]|nr:alkaline phosphatase family protein [Propionibacteriaceae bacterium]